MHKHLLSRLAEFSLELFPYELNSRCKPTLMDLCSDISDRMNWCIHKIWGIKKETPG